MFRYFFLLFHEIGKYQNGQNTGTAINPKQSLVTQSQNDESAKHRSGGKTQIYRQAHQGKGSNPVFGFCINAKRNKHRRTKHVGNDHDGKHANAQTPKRSEVLQTKKHDAAGKKTENHYFVKPYFIG